MLKIFISQSEGTHLQANHPLLALQPHARGLSIGVKTGIGVGAGAAAILATVAVFVLCQRRRRRGLEHLPSAKDTPAEIDRHNPIEKHAAEADENEINEAGAQHGRGEMETSNPVDRQRDRAELQG
jgi:hypothetical protein